MNFLRPSALVTVALVFCACAMMAEAKFDWRSAPAVQKLLQNNRRARVMTQGPIGNIIDIIIDIILILLDFIFGGNVAGFLNDFKSLRQEVEQMKSLVGVLA